MYHTHSELATQQLEAQELTYRTRTLAEYNSMLFSRTSPAAALLKRIVPGQPESFVDLLACLNDKYASEGGLDWADMGAGQAVAMREAAMRSRRVGSIAMQAVDLFGFDAIPVEDKERQQVIDQAGVDIWTPEYRPPLIQADAQTIQLEQAPQLITCFEGLQYIPDPLAAMCNWYNQLASGGLLIIATCAPWNTFMSQANDSGHSLDRMIEQIQDAGIRCATNLNSEVSASTFGFRTLVIERQPGTTLTSCTTVIDQSFTYGQTSTTYGPGPLVEIGT